MLSHPAIQQGANVGHSPCKAATDSHRAKCASLKTGPVSECLRSSVQVVCRVSSWDGRAGYLLQRGEDMRGGCCMKCRLNGCGFHFESLSVDEDSLRTGVLVVRQ